MPMKTQVIFKRPVPDELRELRVYRLNGPFIGPVTSADIIAVLEQLPELRKAVLNGYFGEEHRDEVRAERDQARAERDQARAERDEARAVLERNQAGRFATHFSRRGETGALGRFIDLANYGLSQVETEFSWVFAAKGAVLPNPGPDWIVIGKNSECMLLARPLPKPCEPKKIDISET